MNIPDSNCEPLFPAIYPEYVYNFAFGSNMSPNVLTGRRKILPLESIPGVLEGWQLTFDLRSIPGLEPCFGNLIENAQSEVHGILHKMTGVQFKHLLATEGGSGIDPNGYIPRKMIVHAYDGRLIEAYALVVRQTSSNILAHHALPSARYMSLLRNGATHHRIHPLYIEYLQSLPSIERRKPMLILVIIEILLLMSLFSPLWIPVVIYYVCTNQKPRARAFFFTLILVNLWRIYRFFGARGAMQPYYSAPFPIGSTDFKKNTEKFRTQVQIDEQSIENAESNSCSTTKQRKNIQFLPSETDEHSYNNNM